MTNEQILEQIFDNDSVVYEFEVLPQIKAKIRNLTPEDFQILETEMLNLKGTSLAITQEYALKRIAIVLLTYKKTEISGFEDAKTKLKKLPVSILDKLVTEQNKFEKDIRVALGTDSIENNFFDKAGSPEKQEQLPEELTLESPAP